MTVITLHPHIAPRKRPTVSTPVLRDENVAKSLSSIDSHINLLLYVADGVASDGETGATIERLTEALYFLHTQLRTDCDRLFQLL